MYPLINFIIAIIIFAIAVYGLKWICDSFHMPPPVFWLCGAILLIIALLFIANMMGVSSSAQWPLFPRR